MAHTGLMSQPQPAGWHDQERIRCWIEGATRREPQMAPVSDDLFEAAALQPGETVLDVGVGTGPTTARAARAVGPAGRVIGSDLSPLMIEAARARAPEGIEWLVADAQTYDFGEGAVDAVISRFGVMFFADPVAAFANLARSTRPGGRLAIVVWRTRDQVPMFDLPYQAAARVLDRQGLAYQPVAIDDNQCSLGTAERVASVLAPAGWLDVETRPSERSMYLDGEQGLEAAASGALEIGPIRTLLEGRPPEVVDAVREELLAALRPLHDGTGVRIPAGYQVVTARR